MSINLPRLSDVVLFIYRGNDISIGSFGFKAFREQKLLCLRVAYSSFCFRSIEQLM